MTTDVLTRLTNDATWLADALDPLHQTRLKGTPRPWRQTELTPEQRAALDLEARAEKTARGAGAFGESPAPIHLDVLDLEQNIDTTALTLCQLIEHARPATAITPLLTEHIHRTTAITRLRYIVRNTTHLNPANPHVIHAANAFHGYRTRIETTWGEITIGQRLKAPCPWCGAHQLRFRAIGPDHAQEIVLRCESGTCDPDETHCGTWHHGHPCWPMHEWAWLARWIDDQAEAGAAS